MDTFKRVIHIFLFLSLTLGLLGFNAQPALAAKCTQYHTVKGGDTLAKLARTYKVTEKYIMKLNNLADEDDFQKGDKLCVSTSTAATTVNNTTSWSGGSVSASSVSEDDYVILKGSGLPASTQFDVYMSRSGASNSFRAGSVTTGSGGSFSKQISIPKKLVDINKIAVYIVSGSTTYAKGTFVNEDDDGDGDDSSSSNNSGQTITVTNINEGDSVRIKAVGFPKNSTFEVSMSKRNKSSWIEVDTISTGSKTSFTETFDIPEELEDVSEITIRFECKDDDDYDISTWFENDDDGDTDDDDDIAINVLQVVRNSKVEVRFSGLSTSVTYTVYIGTASEKGTDGAKVGTIKATSSSSITQTFRIPDSMEDESKLAIRIESSSGSAYVTFSNTTDD